jgi:hypothetical protein
MTGRPPPSSDEHSYCGSATSLTFVSYRILHCPLTFWNTVNDV